MLRVMRDEVPRTRDSKSYYVVQVVVEATHIWLVILVQSGMHYNFFRENFVRRQRFTKSIGTQCFVLDACVLDQGQHRRF